MDPRPNEPGYVQARYPAAINELHHLTQNHVMARLFEGDEDDFRYWLEHLLAFEGVPIWRRNPRRDEYPMVCTSCALSLEIDLSYKLPGTPRRDPNARFLIVGREGPVLTGITPAAPRTCRCWRLGFTVWPSGPSSQRPQTI
ncbi:hypothetical protein [Streptomyces sp. NPDC058086]|uniref:hypothetical protein n=1 Tax=Streptomyces sp. NPDC058086 TaxID=3346334 RepID=UPI0036E0C70A